MSNYKMYAANGSTISTYGIRTFELGLGLRRAFTWKFVIADVAKPIIGADFLNHFGLLVYCFKIAQQEDDNLKRIVSFVEDNKTKEYIIRGGLIFKDCDGNIKLVVPKSMTRQVIRSAHERAHFSVAKTTAIVNRDYWISDAKAVIQKIVKNCITCILAERKCGKAEGYLQPLDKGEVPLDTYHIDHLGPLPSTRKNYKHILAVVDAFSKFVWFHAIKGTGNRSNFKAPKTSPPYLEALEEL